MNFIQTLKTKTAMTAIIGILTAAYGLWLKDVTTVHFLEVLFSGLVVVFGRHSVAKISNGN